MCRLAALCSAPTLQCSAVPGVVIRCAVLAVLRCAVLRCTMLLHYAALSLLHYAALCCTICCTITAHYGIIIIIIIITHSEMHASRKNPKSPKTQTKTLIVAAQHRLTNQQPPPHVLVHPG